MTLKTTFEPLDNSTTANFYGNTETTTGSAIIFYLQNLDGTYTEANRFYTGNNSGSFHINDKYTGYHAAYYRTGGSGNWTTVTSKGTDGYYGNAISFNNYFEVRFDRNEYTLTFFTNNGGNDVVDYTVLYEEDISEYANQAEGQKTGYYFLGWYADAGFSQPFDFNTTMPDHNVDVYGYWKMERIRVVIVPGANNVYTGSQALSFRLDYDEKIGGSMLEAATRTGYILDGWYTDPEFTNKWIFSTPVNATVEGVDMTYHTAPKWASTRVAYGDDDEEHDNVRGIVQLYAKWIVDTSQKGVNIEYDPGEAGIYDTNGTLITTIPIDPQIYQEGSNVIVGSAPSGYNELYHFQYWEAIDSEGNILEVTDKNGNKITQLPPGTTFNVDGVTPYSQTEDEDGNPVLKTIRLRAKYVKDTDVDGRYTTITYNGNRFDAGIYPDGTEPMQGRASDGSEQIQVTYDEQINETIVLPGKDDFYLDGYELVGWSFVEGSYEDQTDPEKLEGNINFLPGQMVAADDLYQNSLNDESNILYAMWQPKTYKVTVKQVVESDVPVQNFNYSYKSGVENVLESAASATVTLSGNDSATYTNLTTDPSTQYQYYGRVGHVFNIMAPAIPDNADYDVRVNAIVLRDDGTRETLPLNELGNYEILGDVEITYTYSMKVPVNLEKRALNDDGLLTGSKFVLTPVQWNADTSHWDQVGTTTFDYDMSSVSSLTRRLQEGVYLVEETQAPTDYAMMGEPVLVTVRRGQVFILRTIAGGTVSTSIAKLTGSDEHTLVIYDRPIIPLKIEKAVDGQELDTDAAYTFSAQLTLEGSPMKSYDTVGIGAAADITNGAGIIEFKLADSESRTINVPWGTVVEVSENEYAQFAVETSSENSVADEDTENDRIYKCTVEQEDTVTITNRNVLLTVTKEVEGSANDQTKPFTFTLSGLLAGKIYRFNVAGSSVTRTATSGGTVTFELKHGQTMTISLPGDMNYTVTEAEDTSFDTTITVDNGEPEEVFAKTVNLSTGKSLLFTNTGKNGTLIIRKATTPTGIADTQMFKVSVANSEGQFLQSTSSISFGDTEVWFDVSVSSPLTISELPTDTYVVAEKTIAGSGEDDPVAINGYRYDNTAVSYIDSNDQTVNTGIINANATTTAIITNNYTKLADVTVNKSLIDSTITTGTREFTFTATLMEGETDISDYLGTIAEGQTSFTFTLSPSGTETEAKTFTGIPVGAILTVTEATEPEYTTTVSVGDEEAVDDIEGVLSVAESNNTVNFINTRKTISIVIKKEDNTGHALPGADFTLLSLDTSSPTIVSTLKIGEITQADGVISMEDTSEITISNLASGNYRLVETHAPDGYVILTRGVDFSVDASSGTVTLIKETTETVEGETVTVYVPAETSDYPDASANENVITVKNTPGAALPNTGGPGTNLIYLLGVMLTGIAGAGLVMRRKRKAA